MIFFTQGNGKSQISVRGNKQQGERFHNSFIGNSCTVYRNVVMCTIMTATAAMIIITHLLDNKNDMTRVFVLEVKMRRSNEI